MTIFRELIKIQTDEEQIELGAASDAVFHAEQDFIKAIDDYNTCVIKVNIAKKKLVNMRFYLDKAKERDEKCKREILRKDTK